MDQIGETGFSQFDNLPFVGREGKRRFWHGR